MTEKKFRPDKTNLVRTYVDMRTSSGQPKKLILDDLNGTYGTAYTHSRLAQMARGEHSPPMLARNEMLRAVIDHVLRTEAGVSIDDYAALDRIADRLT